MSESNGNIKQSYVLHTAIGVIGALIVAFFTYYATTQASSDAKRDTRLDRLEGQYLSISTQLAKIEEKLGISNP